MSEEWKPLAYQRIQRTIDTLDTTEPIGKCPVCSYVIEKFDIEVSSPDVGCSSKDDTMLCPALESCRVYADILDQDLDDMDETITELQQLSEMIKTDTCDSYTFYEDRYDDSPDFLCESCGDVTDDPEFSNDDTWKCSSCGHLNEV